MKKILYKVKKFWLILILFSLVICQVYATETTQTLFQSASEINNIMLILIFLILFLIIILIIYLLLSKTLYYANILRQSCKKNNILLFILTESGYKLKRGIIYNKIIHKVVRYYIKYKEDDKIIEFPLVKEHVIRPDVEEKHLPYVILISDKYSINKDELQIKKIRDNINKLIENKEALKIALEKYNISNEKITEFEEKLNTIQERLNYCEEKIRTSFKKEKTVIINEIKEIIEELKEIKDVYEDTMITLVEESKHREELSMKDTLLNIYSDIPFKIDFSKFALLISQIRAVSNLMEDSIPREMVNNKKIFVVVMIIIIFSIIAFLIINSNFKILTPI